MKFYIVNSDGYYLRNGKSRHELRQGDIITTECDKMFGDMVNEVSGSFNMKFHPFQLSVAKITSHGQYTGLANDECSNEHPNFNPKEICFCVIHSGILSDITKKVLRQNKLKEIGI